MKRFVSFLLCGLMLTALFSFGIYGEDGRSEDIVVLYTNDIHSHIDGELSYDVLAAIKSELEKSYKYVLLADAGDHIQGTAYGGMDKGETVIALMNATGYDIATFGNHEFDYGMDGFENVVEWAEYPYVSCNFYREEDGVRGENVFESYALFECGKNTVAFVGVTTPETFTSSTPLYFQDGEGNYIYGISAGVDGKVLFADVQRAVDSARAEGATVVIGLGHLGADESSEPYTSETVIGETQGLNAFIDGHSHAVVENSLLTRKDGGSAVLTQTGEYFDRIGMMVIDAETKEITTDFIECIPVLAADGETVLEHRLSSELYGGEELVFSPEVRTLKNAWLGEIDEKLGQKVGSTDIVFDNYDAEGNRLVRMGGTNTGDFCSDALYYLFDDMGMEVDIAITNGGGIRNRAITGDISYKDCKEIHTFGNVACLQTVTGQQVLDALEWGARGAGEEEMGGFLHVSGLTYKVDTSIPETIGQDAHGVWTGAPEEYRVYDVMVYDRVKDSWEELDLEAEYNLAGYNYILRDYGDGCSMFDGAVNVLDYVMEDYMVLANYIQGFENCTVEADNSPLSEKYPGFGIDYSSVTGSGRITVAEGRVDGTSRQNTVKLLVICFAGAAVLAAAAAGAVMAAKKAKKNR